MVLLAVVREEIFHWYLLYLIQPRIKNYTRLAFPKDLTTVSGPSRDIQLETWKMLSSHRPQYSRTVSLPPSTRSRPGISALQSFPAIGMLQIFEAFLSNSLLVLALLTLRFRWEERLHKPQKFVIDIVRVSAQHSLRTAHRTFMAFLLLKTDHTTNAKVVAAGESNCTVNQLPS